LLLEGASLLEGEAAVDVLILRDPKESAVKCSLTPLRGLEGIGFVNYHPDRRLDAHQRILLHPDGPELSPADRGAGLFLIDCCWRRVTKLLRTVDGDPRPRRLPALHTAYPRRAKTFEDPDGGLASIEALFAAQVLMGEPREELLAAYRWREEFLRLNAAWLEAHR
jgi:pre-rRNA-processing protein TSR3